MKYQVTIRRKGAVGAIRLEVDNAISSLQAVQKVLELPWIPHNITSVRVKELK